MKENSLTQECVFPCSSNPSCSNQHILIRESDSFKPPYPPLIDAKDFITKRSDEQKAPSRSPNAFIIYRKVCIDTARERNCCLPMTIISSLASDLWKNEPPHVKNFYKDVARDISKHYSKRYPKSSQRKKRERWNLISFEKQSHDSSENLNATAEHEHREHEAQSIYPSPELLDFPFEVNTTTTGISEELSEPSERVAYPSPEVNSFESQTLNTEFENENENNNNNSVHESSINAYNNYIFSTISAPFSNVAASDAYYLIISKII